MTSNENDTDGQAISLLARLMYMHYCKEKGFDPYPAPWSPRWAMDYARIAVGAYGYDERGLDELRQVAA